MRLSSLLMVGVAVVTAQEPPQPTPLPQGTNSCSCATGDYLCARQCAQNRILDQAREHASCSINCQKEGSVAAMKCISSCLDTFYSGITAVSDPIIIYNPAPTNMPSNSQNPKVVSNPSDSAATEAALESFIVSVVESSLSANRPTPTSSDTDSSPSDSSIDSDDSDNSQSTTRSRPSSSSTSTSRKGADEYGVPSFTDLVSSSLPLTIHHWSLVALLSIYGYLLP